ncbi:MAG: calcium-translocating P-type ATPase, PMCA-type [Ekhidna sp.]
MKNQGLTSKEAHERLEQYGRNEIVDSHKRSFWLILGRQFSSPLILILIAAAFISFAIGYLPDQEPHLVDTILILAIVLLSGILGFIQDYKAEKTIKALQQMSYPRSRVVRDHTEQIIPSNEIVPGDLLLVEAGDMITADGDVIESFHLDVDESILTGEAQAVHKNIEDLVFKNTVVNGGIGKVLITSTGMKTKIGQVASELQKVTEEQSNFQIELAGLSKKLSLITFFITIIIGVVGVFKFGFYTSILTAISLAVAAIPEGLPAVVVLALAIGARKMFRKNALIRKLPIVESVGAVDIICTDKTGTLTLNEMTVTTTFFDGQEHTTSSLQTSDLRGTPKMLFLCANTCNNASVVFKEDGSQFYLGDQTEIALKKAACLQFGGKVLPTYEKVNELSFNSERKRMTVVVKDQKNHLTAFTKGAPEVVLSKCTHILDRGKRVLLTKKLKDELLDQTQHFASRALRVLGFAYNENLETGDILEDKLTWIGLQAMIDPPRKEARQALEDCKNAGIRVIMITGDNPSTASAIAEAVGMSTNGVLTGLELDSLGDLELLNHLDKGTNIFARTDPFHKLRILELLEKDHTVAMTGDGVNDALAIKRSVVGIAMGKKGTEVAKQASDIVLLDDNFSSIRDAIKEGRTIFDNTRKFIDYLLTCNLAEVALIFFITLFFSFDEPILYPVQLLWINLLTDGLVALALGADPPAKDIMQRPPRKNGEPLIDKQLAWLIGLIGLKKAIVLVITFFLVLPFGLDIARSTLLTGIVLFEFVRIGAIRYGEKLGWFDNKWLVMGLIVSLILQVGLIYSPWNHFFYLTPLGWFEWVILIGGVILGYILAILITRVVKRTFAAVE